MDNHCRFWLPRKNRFCANAPLKGFLFCGNHKPGSEALRIPCPIDPSHTILQENLDVHIKRCPLQKQVQALETQTFYKKGINAGRSDEDQCISYATAEPCTYDKVEDSCGGPCSNFSDVSSDKKRNAIYKMTVPEFSALLTKIKSIHCSIVSNIRDSYIIPEACDRWLKNELDRELPFQEKHVLQQASILGNLEAFGILQRSADLSSPRSREQFSHDDPCGSKVEGPAVVEFGAGRGYLTHMLADCYGIRKVFLVERRSYKLKADRSLRKKQRMTLERLRIDIEDLNLNAVESLKGFPYLAIGKHLCGPATDKRFLSSLKITKDDFHAITWFTSWAVDANHGSDLSDAMDRGLNLLDIDERESGGVEEVVRNMKVMERAVLGLKCKEIIDFGRLMWVKEHGLDGELVTYVPSIVSPENHLLVAKYTQ